MKKDALRTTNTYTNGKDTFEIVKKIPRGFFVWNIGKCMGRDDLIPFCELEQEEAPGVWRINAATLKAVVCPARRTKKVRTAAGWGLKDLDSAREYADKCAAGNDPFELGNIIDDVVKFYEQIYN